MGNKNHKESLQEAIDMNDCDLVTNILKANPQIINEPVSEENPTTPLARAAWRGKIEILYTLFELGADANFVGPQNISPLQWAAQKGKDEAVDYLVQKGAKIDYVSHEKLNALDYAILYGSYNTAWKLINLGLEPKEPQFYKQKNEEKKVLFYDYEKMIDHLKNKIPLQDCPRFNIPPPEKGFLDPVIDPRETWGEFAKRIVDFGEPPLIERDELPRELRPENRTLGKLRSWVNGLNPYPDEHEQRGTAEERNERENEIGESVMVEIKAKSEEELKDKNTPPRNVNDLSEITTETDPHRKTSHEANYSTDALIHPVELKSVKINIGKKDNP